MLEPFKLESVQFSSCDTEFLRPFIFYCDKRITSSRKTHSQAKIFFDVYHLFFKLFYCSLIFFAFHMSRCDLFALAAPGKPVYWTGYPSVRRMPSGDSPEDCHMKGRQESALRIWLDTTPYTCACIGDPHQFAL